MVSGRREAQLQELVELCQSKFGNSKVIYKVAEATSVKDNKELVEFTIEKFGKLDIVVLAAGVAAHSYFENIEDVDILRTVMEVNYMGYVTLTKAALPELRKTKG